MAERQHVEQSISSSFRLNDVFAGNVSHPLPSREVPIAVMLSRVLCLGETAPDDPIALPMLPELDRLPRNHDGNHLGPVIGSSPEPEGRVFHRKICSHARGISPVASIQYEWAFSPTPKWAPT